MIVNVYDVGHGFCGYVRALTSFSSAASSAAVASAPTLG